MSPTYLVPLVLQSLLCIQIVIGKVHALDLKPLYQNNKSPCDFMNEVASASTCAANQRRALLSSPFWEKRDVNVTNPTPTNCTCNNVFFNLWSACTLIVDPNSTPNTLPLYSTWQNTCSSKKVDVGASIQWSQDTYRNPDMPTWASQLVGNGTFDVNLALDTANSQPGWTLLMKLVPMIVGVGVLILAGIAFLIYRHKKGGKMRKWAGVGWRSRVQKLIPRSQDVHEVDRSSTWTIEQFETGYEDYVFVDPASPGSSSANHNTQSFSLSSSSKEQTPPHKLTELQAEWQMPGKATWRGMHIPESVRALPQRFPIPWKRKPILVQSIAHSRRFRLDDYDKSTDASSSRRATSNFSHGTTVEGSSAPAFSRNHDTILEEEEDEGTSLITPLERSENSVFLISREPGVDFSSTESGSSHPRESTVNSHINIQSPTPTSATPSVGQQPFRPHQPSPLAAVQIPPVPTLPAPVPPNNRWIPRPIPEEEEYDHPAALPAVAPHHVRNHSDPLAYSPSQPHRQHSGDSLFSPAQSSSLNGYGILATPSDRSGYASDEAESYFSQSRKPSLDSILRPSPASLPRIITQDEVAGRRGLRPAPSIVASASVEVLQPPATHHRNRSVESIVPNRGDPVMLFPGPVRGAGYMGNGSASISSESLYSQYSQYSQQPSMKMQPNRRPSS